MLAHFHVNSKKKKQKSNNKSRRIQIEIGLFTIVTQFWWRQNFLHPIYFQFAGFAVADYKLYMDDNSCITNLHFSYKLWK